MAYDRTLLTAEALQSFLAEHPGWKHEAGMIRRTYEAPSFLEGIAFVERVARAAEAADHHPDIDIRWRTLTFVLATHSAGGVTEKDLGLAARIDEIVRSATG